MNRKLLTVVALSFFLNWGNTYAQEVVARYLRVASDYALVYNGELEEIYSPRIYKNQPYYQTEEYTIGDLIFQNKHYKEQVLRLDLYRDRLIVVSPQKRTGIYLDGKNVQYVSLHNTSFLYLSSSNPYLLEEGYYQLIAENPYFKILARKNYTLHYRNANYYAEDNVKDRRSAYFSYHRKYYLVNNTETILLKKWSTFAKYFPDIRSELKTYVRRHRLSMKEEQQADAGLGALARYAEELLKERRGL